jgi:hypothetical protein
MTVRTARGLTSGTGAPGRGVIANDFAFRGLSAANKLAKYRDHGPGCGAAGANRTERAKVRRESGACDNGIAP